MDHAKRDHAMKDRAKRDHPTHGPCEHGPPEQGPREQGPHEPERLVKDETVTVASIFKSVLLTFFSQEDLGWNMERIGVKLKCSRGDFVLRSTFGCLLADEKGIK